MSVGWAGAWMGDAPARSRMGVVMGPEDDVFAYELSEEEWDYVRTLLSDITTFSADETPAVGILKKLDPHCYTHFRLSRDRAGEIPYAKGVTRWDYKGDYLFAIPGPTECCRDRIVRPTLKHRWRCYKCGLFIDV